MVAKVIGVRVCDKAFESIFVSGLGSTNKRKKYHYKMMNHISKSYFASLINIPGIRNPMQCVFNHFSEDCKFKSVKTSKFLL